MRLKGSQRAIPYLFLIPGFVLFIAWMIYPLLRALQMSFYNWSLMPGQASQFIGLGNYQHAAGDPIFWRALRNTILYAIVTVAGQMILGFIAALIVNRIVHGATFFRTVYYFPVITSWVVVSLLFKYLFESGNGGLINYVLVNILHILRQPVDWLSYGNTAWAPIMSLGICKGIGWAMLIFLAALQTVPKELYEVASLDGANAWQQVISITLPSIWSTVIFVLVLLMIGGFQAFISVWLITAGGPQQQTEVMLTYMYNQAFNFLQFGYGAAISYILTAIIVVISFIQMRVLRQEPEVA